MAPPATSTSVNSSRLTGPARRACRCVISGDPSASSSPQTRAGAVGDAGHCRNEARSARGPSGGALEQWRRVLECLGQTRPDLVAFLKHAVPLDINPEVLLLGHEPGNVLESAMRSTECLDALRGAALECFGQQPKVVFQHVTGNAPTLAEIDKRAREQQKRAAVDRAQQHQSVRDAVEILGARVKRIEVSES